MVKVLLDHSFANEEIKDKINHTEEFLIDLQKDLSETQSDENEDSLRRAHF